MLTDRFSPEQVTGRLTAENPEGALMHVRNCSARRHRDPLSPTRRDAIRSPMSNTHNA